MIKPPQISKPPIKRDGNDGRSGRRVAPPLPGAAAAAAEARMAAQAQLKSFEQAVHLFHARKFAEARDQFSKATDGPNREMAHNAQLHIRMCDRRLVTPSVELRTAEDHYNYAVALINTRALNTAQQHLETALKMDTGADHVYYALALCRGLSGDLQGACENLRRAIELQPRNRLAARQDTDFASFSSFPAIQQLLFPDKNSASY